MPNPSIPKPVMILIGVIVLVVAIIVGVRQISFMIDQFKYGYPYSSQFTESIQELAFTFVNFYLCFAGIMGALAFIVPTWAGRKLYRTGYALSDEETVPKAYRAGGINLIVAGVLAIAVYVWIFQSYNFYSNAVLFPVVLLVLGITGAMGGINRKT